MLSISSLRKIWNEAQGEYHLYNLLFAINETLSNDGRLCEDNIISPDGLDIMLLSASFRKNYMCLFFDIENYSKFKLPFELLVFIFFSVQKVLLPATFRINEKGEGVITTYS